MKAEVVSLSERLRVPRDATAIVTGGGGVLCGTICRALAEVGMKVAVLDIDLQAARRVTDEIAAHGDQAIAIEADVLSKDSLEMACGHFLAGFGRVDILINGAGGNKKEATTSSELPFFDLPQEAIDWVFRLNLMGTLLPCQLFGRIMAEQGSGCIINITSMAALRPLTRVPAYSAAKAAVSNLTQWLAVYMSQNFSPKIRVNAIAPGFFLTRQNRFLLIDESSGELTPRGQAIIGHTPMRRFGAPEDLVGAVLWLVSPAAEFVHGAIIPIDGGFSAYCGV